MLKQIGISTNDIYQQEVLKEILWNRFVKVTITAPSIEHSITLSLKNLKKLKLFIVPKFSKTRLKFNIVIVQSTEAVVFYKRSCS